MLDDMVPYPGCSFWDVYIGYCVDCDYTGTEGIQVTDPYPMAYKYTCPECGSKKLLKTRMRKPEETDDLRIKKWLKEKWGEK